MLEYRAMLLKHHNNFDAYMYVTVLSNIISHVIVRHRAVDSTENLVNEKRFESYLTCLSFNLVKTCQKPVVFKINLCLFVLLGWVCD